MLAFLFFFIPNGKKDKKSKNEVAFPLFPFSLRVPPNFLTLFRLSFIPNGIKEKRK
jgi:hypothetical protein